MKWLVYEGFWSVSTVKDNYDCMFIFGDNDYHEGKGGQAIIRYEYNAFGIPTKKKPNNQASSFYTDDEYKENVEKIDKAIQRIKNMLYLYRIVYYPEAGLGVGLAKLNIKAPKTFEYLNSAIKELSEYVNNVEFV